MVANLRRLPYQERLRILKLPSLYHRRRRGDMVQTYMMFHGGVDMVPASVFTRATDRVTRGHPYKLLKVAATGRVRRSAFAIRVVNDWNSLPADVVCSPSPDSFKASLDAHWAHLRYHVPDTD